MRGKANNAELQQKQEGGPLQIVEIRCSDGHLLIGQPGAMLTIMRTASDQQRLASVLRGLSRDPAACEHLRRGWRRLFPQSSAASTGTSDMVVQLQRALSQRRLSAVFLREAEQPVAPAKLRSKASPVVQVRVPQGVMVFAPQGRMPTNLSGGVATSSVAQMLRTAPPNSPLAQSLAQQSHQFSTGSVGLISDSALLPNLAWQLESGGMQCSLLTAPVDIALAAARSDAPVSIGNMDAEDRIAEALRRSRYHLKGEALAAVEEMLQPENLAIMVGVLAAVGAAHLFPPAGAAIDATLLVVGWVILGLEGIQIIETLFVATVKAVDAESEAEINEAARLYASAFVRGGKILISALLKKFVKKQTSKTDNPVQTAKGATVAKDTPAATPKTTAAPPSAPKAPPKFGQRSKATEPGARRATKKSLQSVRNAKRRRLGTLKKEGWPDIPGKMAKTFKGHPKAIELEPGQKIFRVIDAESNPNGGFWTTQNPAKMTEAQWRSGAAVRNEWNGDGAFVEYEVPKGGLKVWSGNAAAQMSSDGKSVLGGGGNQLWIAQDAGAKTNASLADAISTGWGK